MVAGAGTSICLWRRHVRRKLRVLLAGMGVPICIRCGHDIFEVLVGALCCIMVSDRSVSTSERKRIHEIMKQAKCPWNPDLIDQCIDQFVARVKDGQYRRLLEATCENVKVFKEQDKKKTLLKCLAAVAKADGKIEESERKVYERFKIALE